MSHYHLLFWPTFWVIMGLQVGVASCAEYAEQAKLSEKDKNTRAISAMIAWPVKSLCLVHALNLLLNLWWAR